MKKPDNALQHKAVACKLCGHHYIQPCHGKNKSCTSKPKKGTKR